MNKSAYAEYKSKDTLDSFGAISNKGVIYHSNASRDVWKNIETNTTVRDYYTRQDYEYFRPNEALAKKPKDIIKQCMGAYKQVGLLRNVIDLMSDFGSQGIKLVHPNENIQKFYRDWFEQVKGADRSERFLSLLYRAGIVPIRRTNAKITRKIKRDMRAYAADKPEKKPKIEKNVIPWRYTFISPALLDVVGDELTQFVGENKYALKVPSNLYNIIKYPKNAAEKQLVAKIPQEIRNAIIKGDGTLILDKNDVTIKFYKKDDWQNWADPMLYSIMDDVIMLEKLKLADRAALDGIISQVRLWKLGNLDKDVLLFPDAAAVNKLINILSSNPGGGPFDIVWGPELTFEETSTEAYKFLGQTKYDPTLNNIYAGLGIPSTLTGAGDNAGFTNNFISIKTLVKRLEYGRSVLTGWWNEELYRVQKAMGFKRPATVQYDRMILTDESAEKALLKDMWDRNLITDSTILERLGEDAEMERLISNREEKERKAKKRLPKAGPYLTAEKEHELAKLAIGKGFVKPSDVGVDVTESYEKEPFIEILNRKPTPGTPGKSSNPSSNTGVPGRPNNSKDSVQRTRTVKPRTSAEVLLWAKEAQGKIAEILTPYLLSFFNKQNLRSLSSKEFEQCEMLKFSVLSRLEPFEDIIEEKVLTLCSNINIPEEFVKRYKEYTYNKKMTIEDKRLCQAAIYSELI